MKSKRIAIVFVLLAAVVGVLFLSLDILDIAEDFRIDLPTPELDTILIAGSALLATGLALKKYRVSGVCPLFWLGLGALAFGLGNLTRWWQPVEGLDIPITTYDTAVLLAAMLHFIGALVSLRARDTGLRSVNPRRSSVFIGSAVVLIIIGLIVWLIHRGIIPSYYEHSIIREVVVDISAALFIAGVLIYFRLFSRLRRSYIYWYSLGLMLFAIGSISLSFASIESRLFWLGKAAHYAGFIYLIISVSHVGINARKNPNDPASAGR